MDIRLSLRKKSIMALTIYLFLITALIGSITYWVVEPPVRKELQRGLDLRGELLASRIDQQLEPAVGVVSSIVGLTQSNLSPAELTRNIKHILAASPSIIASGGLWPDSQASRSSNSINSLFFNRKANGVIDQIHSYNNPQAAPYQQESWYMDVVNNPQQKIRWSNVYVDTYTQKPMLTLSMPYSLGGQFAGVATVDLSLDSILYFIQAYTKEHELGVILTDHSGSVLLDNNFILKQETYISKTSVAHLSWDLQVINSKRSVADDVVSQVFNIELGIVPILLICVICGYYLIIRYLIKPITEIAEEIDSSEGVITLDYKHDDEIGHLINKFNKKTVYLEQEKVKAQASTAAKTAFLATLSHEIRTPMNGVLGTAQILLKTDLNHSQRKYLQSLYDSGGHMMTLLNEILDFSKIEQGHLELDNTAFPLETIIGSINSVYYTLCSEKGLKFKVVSTIATDRWYFADKARLRQILFNLINNAIKFTQHGYVEVLLSEVIKENSTYLHIEVKDSGIGISKEAQQRIFKPFEQAESSTTRRYGGTGLGLAIVKQITELMDGNIRVESQEHIGTTFIIDIALEITEPEMVEIQSSYKMEFDGLNVLIVEDNRTNTIIIETFMKKKKFTTYCVDNGQKAVEAIKTQPFDLILMDNHMPVMDGVDATRAIRELKTQFGHILIFGCTADVFKETRERMFTAGVDHIVAKPIDERELDDALQRFVDKLYQYQPKLKNEQLNIKD